MLSGQLYWLTVARREETVGVYNSLGVVHYVNP